MLGSGMKVARQRASPVPVVTTLKANMQYQINFTPCFNLPDKFQHLRTYAN